jgi:hypothetical protein
MAETNNPPPSLDERLGALVQNAQQQHHDIAQMGQRVDQLTETSERHERETQRFRRAMRAALQAWISEDSEDKP